MIENVKYFTIDNDKLYTVTQDDTFELNYYEID